MNRKIYNDLADYILDKFDVNIIEANLDSIKDVVDYLDDKVVGEYFGSTDVGGNYWKPTNNWPIKLSGEKLVNRMKEEDWWKTWLDVGCGQNVYKNFFPQVIGIDPYNSNADHMVGVMEYEPPHQFDVVTVMGSINFGDRSVIEPQVERAVSFCKPGGKMFWRFNPGITHTDPNNKAYWIDFFEWSPELIIEFADKFDCTVNEISWDNPNHEKGPHLQEERMYHEGIRYGNRHYSEWTKK